MAALLSRTRRAIWALLAILRVPLPRRLLPGFRGPLLSVVMPVYNVEAYVEAAVRSVLRQSHRNLELIVIDDGSLDGSTAIVRRLARRDPRIRYVRTPNGGLAAARNRGAERARGTYLTFVDSDDIIPAHGYEAMVTSLEESGSDLVTGNVVRLREGQSSHPSWNQRDSHAATVQRTTVGEHPLLVRDTTAWNKMFRRSYAERIGLEFPEGRLYEDMVPITRAMLLADGLDVLSEVTYRWRVRDEVNSITQRRFEIPNVTDKIDMLLGCLDLVEGDDDLRAAMSVKAFEADLWTYAEHVGVGDEAFDEQFQRAMDAMWRDEFLTTMKLRSIGKLVFYAAHRFLGREKAAEAFAWGSRPWQQMPTTVTDGDVRVVPPTQPDLSGIPDSAFSLTRLIDAQARITQLHWVDGRLRVRGFCYLPQVCDADQQQLTARLVGPAGLAGSSVDLEVGRRDEKYALTATRCPFYDLLGSGFEVHVDPAALTDGTWTLQLSASALGIERTTEITSFRFDGSVRTVHGARDDVGRLVSLTARNRQPFTVTVAAPGPVAVDARAQGSAIELDVVADQPVTEVWHTDAHGRRRVDAAVTTADAATIARFAAVPATPAAGLVHARVGGRPQPVRWFGDQVGDGALTVSSAPATSQASVTDRTGSIEVDDLHVEQDGPSLVIAGHVHVGSSESVTVHLLDQHGGRHASTAVEPAAGGRFEVSVLLTGPGGDGVVRVLPHNRYELAATDGTDHPVAVQVTDGVGDALPTVTETPLSTVELHRSEKGALLVFPIRPFTLAERGVAARRRMGDRWWRGSQGPVQRTDSVFLSSFDGNSTGCHPGAIGRELLRRGFAGDVFVEVDDRSVPLPDGVTPVLSYSEDWYRAVGTSRWVVNNTAFPVDVQIGDDQTYLQTWHGTPLKRIGRDIKRVVMSRAWLDRAEIEAQQQWTHLLSASPFTTEVLPPALAFDGPVLELGSPRLDTLVSDPTYARDRVRRLLGIPDDHVVVLYTPTWRDGGGVSELLDVERFSRQLGRSTSLLVRAHPNLLGKSQKRLIAGATVHDVSRYPVIEDLYSAADAMVTDYSSTMFDFAATGRPQVMFTPDIATYRDDVRGFYVDFDEWAPGPFAATSDEVLELLRDVPALAARDEQRRARFVERFLPREDGQAAARVIDALGIQ